MKGYLPIHLLFLSTGVVIDFVLISPQVVAEGLTGNISFTEGGRRQGYSMDVVEMAQDSQLVKVSTDGRELISYVNNLVIRKQFDI